MGAQATQITHGIKISVETKYQPEHSSVEHRHFLFSYRITFENNSDYTVQLLSRHWDIFDSSSEYDTVDGPGVVGEQPTLEPGEIFEYSLSFDNYYFNKFLNNLFHKVLIKIFYSDSG